MRSLKSWLRPASRGTGSPGLAGREPASPQPMGPSPDVVELARALDQLRVEHETNVRRLQDDIESLRADIWASKVVPVGDRLLVGCRHLNLVYYIQTNDKLIGPRFIVEGEYETPTTAFMMRTVKEDHVCIDVGANFGYYSCMMAHLAWRGRVLAYEADPQMHALLVDNVAINWSEGIVQPFNTAVGADFGTLTLHRWIDRSGNTGVISPRHYPGFELATEQFDIACLPLDSLVDDLHRLDLVKVDVEGAETMVVAGMGRLVQQFRPVVVLEWSPTQIEAAGSSTHALASALKTWGLSIYTIRPDGTLGATDFDTLVGLSFQNVVLAPEGRFDA
jgi:FkbM family methyltransferase